MNPLVVLVPRAAAVQEQVRRGCRPRGPELLLRSRRGRLRVEAAALCPPASVPLGRRSREAPRQLEGQREVWAQLLLQVRPCSGAPLRLGRLRRGPAVSRHLSGSCRLGALLRRLAPHHSSQGPSLRGVLRSSQRLESVCSRPPRRIGGPRGSSVQVERCHRQGPLRGRQLVQSGGQLPGAASQLVLR